MGTIVVASILFVIVALIIVRLVQNKKKGKSSCGCKCSACACAGSCHKKEKKL
ncbi:MAG: FeoB-associated Cys-rich membrane protein [Treponema sp.]|nr:FeoB-associated Cys-rich membrane protein [Treponema sp.]